jgi:Lrp/AsnC family leucine-responsive transcriptional regulator
MQKIDAVDLAIIRALRSDGRRKYKSIANEVGISTTAVQSRVNKLKRYGIITGFAAAPTINAFGKYITQLCIRTKESDTKRVIDFIYGLKLENARIRCWECIGHYNILSWIHLQETIDLHAITYVVRQNPSVIEVRAVVLTEFRHHPEDLEIYLEKTENGRN